MGDQECNICGYETYGWPCQACRAKKLIQVIKFYADTHNNWFSGGMEGDGKGYSDDMGNKARELLIEIEHEDALNKAKT